MIENDYYCMTLAREIGLDVASVTMRRAWARCFLAIERYDQARDAGGRLVRLHQDDFV